VTRKEQGVATGVKKRLKKSAAMRRGRRAKEAQVLSDLPARSRAGGAIHGQEKGKGRISEISELPLGMPEKENQQTRRPKTGRETRDRAQRKEKKEEVKRLQPGRVCTKRKETVREEPRLPGKKRGGKPGPPEREAMEEGKEKKNQCLKSSFDAFMLKRKGTSKIRLMSIVARTCL